VGVPTSPPCGEEGLGDETSRETYCAPGACSLWRLSPYFLWRCWSAAGLGWRAAGVVLNPFHHVGGLDSISWYSDLPAQHDNFKSFVGARYYFVRATVWRFQGTTWGILSQKDMCRVSEVLVDQCGWGRVACCRGWSM